MFAIIKTGGKQYNVSPGDTIKIEKLEAEEGSEITFDEVLLLGGEEQTTVGKPVVKGAQVKAQVAKQGRNKKVIVYNFKNKVRFHGKQGHRQPFTEVEITDIVA